MKRVLVTGGAGFVGSAVALSLKADGLAGEVVALDNLKRRGSELNLPRLKAGGVNFVHGDVRQAADLESCGTIDALIDCSAEPSVQAGYGSDPRYVVDTNLGGTIACLEWARRCEAALLFLSTSRVYPIAALRGLAYSEGETRLELAAQQPVTGASERGISEGFPLAGVRSLYGATKLCSELLLQEYAALYGLPLVINRCGIIAGPWQMGKSDQGVVALWCARHLYGGTLRYIGFGGSGKQVRDMLHVDDLVRLVLLQLRGIEKFSGALFNAGGGAEVSLSLLELTALCAEYTGARLEIGSTPETHPADVPIYMSDNEKLTRETGWAPALSAAAIVRDTVAWMRAEKGALAQILQ